MNNLKPYVIPIDIKNLETGLCRNMDKFVDLVKKSRYDKNSYCEALTSMLYMEEAANSSHVWKMDLQCVKLILNSTTNRIYKVQHNVRLSNFFIIHIFNDHLLPLFQENSYNFYRANSALVDGLTITPAKSSEKAIFAGSIEECDDTFFYLKIKNGFDVLQYSYTESALFDINFHPNRLSFELQHHALKYIKEHDLFDLLINHSSYNNANAPNLKISPGKFR